VNSSRISVTKSLRHTNDFVSPHRSGVKANPARALLACQLSGGACARSGTRVCSSNTPIRCVGRDVRHASTVPTELTAHPLAAKVIRPLLTPNAYSSSMRPESRLSDGARKPGPLGCGGCESAAGGWASPVGWPSGTYLIASANTVTAPGSEAASGRSAYYGQLKGGRRAMTQAVSACHSWRDQPPVAVAAADLGCWRLKTLKTLKTGR